MTETEMSLPARLPGLHIAVGFQADFARDRDMAELRRFKSTAVAPASTVVAACISFFLDSLGYDGKWLG